MRDQPVLQRAQQRVIGQIGPPGIRAVDPAQKPDTCAPCLGLFAPRQRGKTGLANALEHRGGDQIGGRCRQSPFAQRQGRPAAFAAAPPPRLRAHPNRRPRAQRCGRRKPLRSRLGATAQPGRCAPRALSPSRSGYGQIILGGQRVGGGQDRAAPVAQQELAVAPRTALGDAIGIGFGQDDARIVEITALIRGLDAPPPLLGLLPHLVQHGAVDREAGHFDIARFAGNDFQPQPQIGIAGIVPTRRLHQIARREHGGDVASQPAHAARVGGQDHMGETRMQTETRHRAAVFRHLPRTVQRIEPRQQIARLAIGGIGRRVEPGELRDVRAPGGKFEGPAARDRWPGFPARNTAPTPCARPRAKGDNRCRALDGRARPRR